MYMQVKTENKDCELETMEGRNHLGSKNLYLNPRSTMYWQCDFGQSPIHLFVETS